MPSDVVGALFHFTVQHPVQHPALIHAVASWQAVPQLAQASDWRDATSRMLTVTGAAVSGAAVTASSSCENTDVRLSASKRRCIIMF